MTAAALALVIAAGFLHSGWNLMLKRSGDKDAFSFLMLVCASVLFAPLFVYLTVVQGQVVPRAAWVWLAAAALANGGYYFCLGRAYALGELSVVYPVARGTAALLVPLFAGALLREQMSLLGALGLGCILAGLCAVHYPGIRSVLHHPASRYALLAGAFISLYTTFDKAGVGLAPLILYIYLTHPLIALVLAPYVLSRKRAALVETWRNNWRSVVLAGVATAVTYGFVLAALRIAKASYVGPAREVSLVFGVLFGLFVLHERGGAPRVVGAGMITTGMAVLALAR